ncbi:MAG: phosphatidylglycerophosphatase A [Pirellulales bacterium]|nr:phosphatidylglycerophosphatase A [Pirellulales bacterium]
MSNHHGYSRLAVWLATGLGIGLVSPAPGTVGGLWGLPLAWAIGCLANPGAQILVIVVVGAAGVSLCSSAATALGGSKDPQAIVLDEIAALPIVYLGFAKKNLAVWLLGWLLFRLLDISKPWPIRRYERLPGGWGIMADDWMAAVYACLVLHGLVGLDRVLNLGWIVSAG